MITKYDQYVNEEISLFGALKKMFGKLLQNVSDELKKPVEELTAKLSKTKKKKNMKIIINDYLGNHNEVLSNDLAEAKTIQEVKKLVKENLLVLYTTITASIKTLGDNAFTFDEIFADSPESIKRQFNKNERRFKNNLNSFVNNVLIKFGKTHGFKKEVIDVKPQPQPEQVKTNDNYSFKLDDNKIFEEVDPPEAGTEQTPGTQVKIPPQAQANAQPEGKKKSDEEELKEVQQNEEELTRLKALTEDIKKWFGYSFYKPLKDGLKKDTKDVGQEGQIAFKTNNITGANKILNNIKVLDKNGLAKVRDLLIQLGHGQVSDYGKFGDPKK